MSHDGEFASFSMIPLVQVPELPAETTVIKTRPVELRSLTGGIMRGSAWKAGAQGNTAEIGYQELPLNRVGNNSCYQFQDKWYYV